MHPEKDFPLTGVLAEVFEDYRIKDEAHHRQHDGGCNVRHYISQALVHDTGFAEG